MIRHEIADYLTLQTKTQNWQTLMSPLTRNSIRYLWMPHSPHWVTSWFREKIPFTHLSRFLHFCRRVWHYRSADWDRTRSYIASYPWCPLYFSQEDSNILADSIADLVLQDIWCFVLLSEALISNKTTLVWRPLQGSFLLKSGVLPILDYCICISLFKNQHLKTGVQLCPDVFKKACHQGKILYWQNRIVDDQGISDVSYSGITYRWRLALNFYHHGECSEELVGFIQSFITGHGQI